MSRSPKNGGGVDDFFKNYRPKEKFPKVGGLPPPLATPLHNEYVIEDSWVLKHKKEMCITPAYWFIKHDSISTVRIGSKQKVSR
jgi:hypothetical protein